MPASELEPQFQKGAFSEVLSDEFLQSAFYFWVSRSKRNKRGALKIGGASILPRVLIFIFERGQNRAQIEFGLRESGPHIPPHAEKGTVQVQLDARGAWRST
jgi:hypothetical protein